ncbi:hypothetical protein AVEN_11974-1 [Araneus ventricosus]|uniref:Uncharacterized protein n=1 Tax=Araneus ventricosus TaxID=182803 RepID=A0A4Y2T332_ARAVE|nr:hypothetical protein AVEN_11974-1 [Araneus ventricosus]
MLKRYLTSVFVGHSTAEDISKAFNDSTKKLDLRKVIQISMDGPAVNWKFFHMIQEQIRDDFQTQLLNIGSCGLHILNSALKRTGLKYTGKPGNDLAAEKKCSFSVELANRFAKISTEYD